MIRIPLLHLLVFAMGVLAVGVSDSNAQSTAVAQQRSNKRTTTRTTALTPEREAAVFTFVRENHPELERLLRHLKRKEPAAYKRAARDLFRTSERLAQSMERDEVRYELELALWQTKSRAQLISAQLRVNPKNESLRKKLRELLNKQVDLRIALLERERDRVSNRLNNLNAQIDRIRNNQSQSVERQIKALTRKKRRGGDNPNRTKKPKKTNSDKKKSSSESSSNESKK